MSVSNLNVTSQFHQTSIKDSFQIARITKTVRFSSSLGEYLNKLSVHKSGLSAKCGSKQSKKPAKGMLVKNDSISSDWHVSPCRPWISNSQRWIARLEYLSEVSSAFIRTLQSTQKPGLSIAYCDNQRNLFIGNGPDFSSVYLALMQDGSEVAVKKINIKRSPLLLNKNVCDAITSLSHHPSILRVRFIARDKTHFYVIRDLGEYSLEQMMRMRQYSLVKKDIDSLSRILCLGLAEALKGLHDNNVLHMDLKPENIMVDGTGEKVYLSDYGIHARTLIKVHAKNEGAGSYCWCAHEILQQHNLGSDSLNEYTTSSDIASLGMLFYYIMTEGGHPFGSYDNPNMCSNNILHGIYNLKAVKDPFAHHLIKHMIFKEPQKRLHLSQVSSHPYFWSEDDRNRFVSSLSEFSVTFQAYQHFFESESSTYKTCEIIDQLKSAEADILCSYVSKDHLQEIPDRYHHDLVGLLAFIHDCSHNETILKPTLVSIDKVGHAKKFWTCFPGLLLHFYSVVTIEDLDQIKCETEHVLHNYRNSHPVPRPYSANGLLTMDDSNTKVYCDTTIFEMEVDETSKSFTLRSASPQLLDSDYDEDDVSYDDGIDVGSPLFSPLNTNRPFQYPESEKSFVPLVFESSQSFPNTSPKTIISPQSPESYASSVDNHFEFGAHFDCFSPEKPFSFFQRFRTESWTDIDELD